MKKLLFLLFLISIQTVWAQELNNSNQPANESIQDSLPKVHDSFESFMSAKRTQNILWYSGIGLLGLGATSFILASHYDGLAANHRNHAAKLFEEGNNSTAYRDAYNRTNELHDVRNFYRWTGSILMVLGSGILTYEIFENQGVSVHSSLNGVELGMRF